MNTFVTRVLGPVVNLSSLDKQSERDNVGMVVYYNGENEG